MNKKLIFYIKQMKNTIKPFKLFVKGNSMYPTFKDKQEIEIIPYKNKNLKVGDIIVYQKFNSHLTVHRILDIIFLNDRRFYCITKGDNNTKKDDYIVFNSEIIGIVEESNYEKS